MLNIDKKKLQQYYINKEYDKFFADAKKITDFVLVKKFYMYNSHKREEMSQECLENLWKKVLQDKIDPTKNLMSFIWTNSYRRIQEIFRKEYNRSKIASFISYEYSDLYDFASYASYRYMDPEIASALLEGVV